MPGLAKLIPSPRALLIFEAAARAGTCSEAAREFNLTQPSVSRNIAQLEQHLGVILFTRSPVGLELTPEALSDSRHILLNYGNMSSPSVIFVLERLMPNAHPGQLGCAMSFGPGVTAETMLFHAI